MEWLYSKIDIGGGPEVDQILKDEYGYILRLSAVYPYLRTRLRIVTLVQIISFISTGAFFAYCFIQTSIHGIKDVNTATQGIHYFIILLFFATMALSILLSRNEVNELHLMFKTNYYQYEEKFDIKDEDQWKNDMKTAKRTLMLSISGFIFIAFLCVIVVPLIEIHFGFKRKEIEGIDMRLPIPIWHPFSKDEPIVAIELTLFMLFATLLLLLIACGGNIFLIYNVMAVLLQFKILHKSIELLPERATTIYKTLYPKRRWMDRGVIRYTNTEMTKDKLANCYIYCLKENIEHQLVLQKVIKLLMSVWNAPIAVGVVCASIAMAISLVGFVFGDPIPSVYATSAIYLVAESAEIAYVCYGGQKIIDQNEILRNVIYDLKWSTYPKEVSIFVKIMMENAKHPIQVKAGGLFVINNETLTNVMHSTYAYLNLLLAVHRKLTTNKNNY